MCLSPQMCAVVVELQNIARAPNYSPCQLANVCCPWLMVRREHLQLHQTVAQLLHGDHRALLRSLPNCVTESHCHLVYVGVSPHEVAQRDVSSSIGPQHPGQSRGILAAVDLVQEEAVEVDGVGNVLWM